MKSKCIQNVWSLLEIIVSCHCFFSFFNRRKLLKSIVKRICLKSMRLVSRPGHGETDIIY